MSTPLPALSAVVAVVAFAVAFILSDLVRVARRAAEVANSSLKTMRDPTLDDAAKEAAARAGSGRLFLAFATIALRSALVLLAPVAVVYGLDALGVASADATMDILLRWDFIIGTTVVALGAWALMRRWA